MHCEYHADAQTHAQKFAWFSRCGGSPASCLAAPARFPRPARDADLLDLTEAALSAWQPHSMWTRRSTAAPWVRGKIIGNSHTDDDEAPRAACIACHAALADDLAPRGGLAL
jgi:hypothetical protein